MKLVKRISIALLAACVVGGSALAMTACGGTEEDPTPVSSEDTAAAASADASFGMEETASAAKSDQEDPTADFVEEMVVAAYKDKYLEMYSQKRFIIAMEELGDSLGATEFSLTWYDSWTDANAAVTAVPLANEIPFACHMKYKTAEEAAEYYIYLVYNEGTNLISTSGVTGTLNGTSFVKSYGDAQDWMLDLLRR